MALIKKPGSAPAVNIRGIRQKIPPGYVLGRTSKGNGPPELINMNSLLSAKLVGSKVTTTATKLQALLDSIGGTAVGSLLVRGASGWGPLVPVAAGDVLTDGGVGNLPSWQPSAAAGGGFASPIKDGADTYWAMSNAGLSDPSLLLDINGKPIYAIEDLSMSDISDYVVGTWTPVDASGAGLTFTSVVANYVQVGKLVFASTFLSWPATANTNATSIGGLPLTVKNANSSFSPTVLNASSLASPALVFPNPGTTTAFFQASVGSAAIKNSALTGIAISFVVIYEAA